jgi:hypothetical protein
MAQHAVNDARISKRSDLLPSNTAWRNSTTARRTRASTGDKINLKGDTNSATIEKITLD